MNQFEYTSYVVLGSRWGSDAPSSKLEVISKFHRAGFDSSVDHVTYISRTNTTYTIELTDYITLIGIKKTRKFRFIHDLCSFFTLHRFLQKNNIKPNYVVVAEPLLILSTIIPKIKLQTKSLFFLTNLPKDLVKTRQFSLIKLISLSVSQKVLFKFVDYFIVINNATKQYVLRAGVEASQIKLLEPNVISRDMNVIPTDTTNTLHQTFDIPVSKKIILSVGRLEPEKDFKRLLTNFSYLSDTYHLVICGSGSLRAELDEIVSKLNITNRVHFTGYVSREEIWSYYKEADVFILLSTSEALGLVVWEAMYMKCPVIVSEADGLIESVGKSGERGYILLNNASPKDFITCVTKAVDRTAKTQDKIECAYTYVMNKTNNQKKLGDILPKINI